MPKELDEFYAEKHSIINEMYIATADDNYVLARWSFHQDLDVDFFWLAVHSIEKYLKAALLINGESSKDYNHDISKLYPAVYKLAPELFPTVLKIPDEWMSPDFWRAETTTDFLARLYRVGQADNRYQVFGYMRHAEDLWKLDQIVFAIRRVCRPLEAYVLGKAIDGSSNISNRQWLANSLKQWRLNSKLEDTMSGKRGPILEDAALLWNFPFAAEFRKQQSMTYKYSSREPVLVRRIYDPLKAGPSNFEHNDKLWDWVKNNIQLHKNTVRDIEEERRKIKASHNTV